VDGGVDGARSGRRLWDDAGASSSTPTRILAARSSSSSNPLNTYDQVSQRFGRPPLPDAVAGALVGRRRPRIWLCSTSSSGSINGPRLARLTAPS
jgi:hypothetical protein